MIIAFGFDYQNSWQTGDMQISLQYAQVYLNILTNNTMLTLFCCFCHYRLLF